MEQRTADPFYVDILCAAFYSLRDFGSYFFTWDEIFLLRD